MDVLKHRLSLLWSQQDMKDEEITDREGHRPTADTIGAMAIGSAGTREPGLIHDVPGNLFRCSHAGAITSDSK